MESLYRQSGVGCVSYKSACSRQDRSPCPGALQVERKPYMLHWKEGEGGQLLFRTLCASPPPHLRSTKGTLPLVPTHKEFLRHCWAHHDNWVLNKAFLLGILPFTGERGGDNSQRRERQRERGGRGRVRREGGGA